MKKTLESVNRALRPVGNGFGFIASMRGEQLVVEGEVQALYSQDEKRNEERVLAAISQARAGVAAVIGDAEPVSKSMEEVDKGTFLHLSVTYNAKDVLA